MNLKKVKDATQSSFESLVFEPSKTRKGLKVATVATPDDKLIDVATRDDAKFETMVYEENSAGFVEGPYANQTKEDVQKLLDKYLNRQLKF